MTDRTVESWRQSNDYVRALQMGLILAISLRMRHGWSTASLDAPGLLSSLRIAFKPDELSVQPRPHPLLPPTLWVSGVSLDLTDDEAKDIQAFIDQARREACGGAP